MVAGLVVAQPALAAGCVASGGTVTAGGCVVSDGSGTAINVDYGDPGNLTVTSTAPIAAAGSTGVRVYKHSPAPDTGKLTVNVTDVTTNVGGTGAGLDISDITGGGGIEINATGTVTATNSHAIRINATDGSPDGPLAGPLTITTEKIVTGTRAAPSDTFTSGGRDGIQLIGAVGSATTPQATQITTGDIDVSTTGVNLAYSINRVDGATTVKTGDITAGDMGLVIDSADNAHQYLIDVTTGNVTSGGTGVAVNQSGTGGITIKTDNVQAGTALAATVNGSQRAGGYGIRMNSDAHGTTAAGQSDFDLTAGNVTVTDGSGALAGTGVAFGTVTNGGNGDTTATVGDIQAGIGVLYRRTGTGVFDLTTGDVTASTGNGVDFGQNYTHNDVSVKTGDITAKGMGIYGDTAADDTGTLTVTAGDVTAGNTGLYLIHSGAKDFTVTAGNVTSTGAGGLYLRNDGNNPATSPTTLKATVASVTAAGDGVTLIKSSAGDVDFHSTGLVKSTGGSGVVLAGFNNGDINIATDGGVDAAGNGIDLGGSANGAANTGSVTITSGGIIKAGGVGINGDAGGSTASTTITVADMDTGSTGVNWINSGTKPFIFTSTGTITAGGVGIDLTTDSVTQNPAPASTDSESIINVNNITTANNTAINVNSNAAKGTTINVNGAISTPATSVIGGDGMRVAEASGPLTINIAKDASITSYNNTMEIQSTSATADTIVNVDGTLISTANVSGSDGVIWAWNHGNSKLIVNLGADAVIQAADPTGYAVTDNAGDSEITVAGQSVTGGFRLGAGNDALTFNGTDMTNIGTLDGGDDASTADGMVDTLNLNGISNFTRDLATAGQEVENWEAVNINGGSADLKGTLTTGQFTLGEPGNKATLSIGAGAAGDSLTVTGDYVGNGGIIALDANATNHTADTFNVNGNVSGVTALSVNDLTTAASDMQDINVVNVDGASPGTAFVLASGPAVMGGINYVLGQGDTASGQDASDWYLAAQACPPTASSTLGCLTDDTLTVDGTTTVGGNVEGGGGRDEITVADGASVVGAVAGGDAGADASAPTDTADTIVINTSGSVGSVQGNLGSNTIYVIGNSTVNGDVDGNGDASLTNSNPSAVTNLITIGGAGPNGTATGNPTVAGNVNGGDSVNKIWVLGGAQVGGSVNGGDYGNTIVLNGSGANVAGSINGGIGDDTIALLNGTAGGVDGSDGDDNIQLSGATVTGNVAGGKGSNQITLSSGSVGGDVYGGVGSSDAAGNGDGVNTISLAGATVTGDIFAGSAGDIIALNGGSVSNVNGGVGADSITLAGATVTGDIDAGDAGDTIALNGGSVTNVNGGAGADAITLAGAQVGGAISGAAGDDIVNLNSGTVAAGVNGGAGADTVNVAGATFTLGSTKLDGGTAGEDNVLNLNNVDQTLVSPQNNLVDWDTVNATDSILTVSGGDSLTAAQVKLTNSTFIAHNGFTVDGNLTLDPSTIDMQNGVAGSSFAVSGDYASIGAGNALRVDADFVANKADELNVQGEITGHTTVYVNDVTPAGTKATGEDVVIATAGNGVQGQAFSLANGSIVNGIWSYTLQNNPNNAVLVGQYNQVGALYESSAGLLSDGFTSLPTWQQRVGQHHWLTREDNPNDAFQGVWLRTWGGSSEATPTDSTTNASSRSHTWGTQAGVQFQLVDNEKGRLMAGATLGYRNLSSTVYNPVGEGQIDAHSTGLGLTFTWIGTGGTYADFQTEYNQVTSDFSAEDIGSLGSNVGGQAMAASLELGHRFALDAQGNNSLVPQVQLSWGDLDLDSFTDKQGNKVDFGSGERLVGRLGVAYRYQPEGDSKMVYAIANVLHKFSPESEATVNGQTVSADNPSTWYEVGAGASYKFTANTMVYGEVDYSSAFENGSGNDGVSGTIGIGINW